MRPWLLTPSLLLAALYLSPPAAAQEAPALPPPPPIPAPWQVAPSGPLPAPVAAPPPVDPLFATGRNQLFDIEALLGFPTGLRLQIAPYRHEGFAVQLEAMAGVFGIFPAAALGGRLRFTPCRGERNALVIKPGVDVYEVAAFDLLGGTSHTVTLVGPDVEVVWFHNWGCCGLELGVDGGVLVSPNSSGWVPLIGLIAGLRF